MKLITLTMPHIIKYHVQMILQNVTLLTNFIKV
jgi:hypothetical protein